jgi:hypothetical protein
MWAGRWPAPPAPARAAANLPSVEGSARIAALGRAKNTQSNEKEQTKERQRGGGGAHTLRRCGVLNHRNGGAGFEHSAAGGRAQRCVATHRFGVGGVGRIRRRRTEHGDQNGSTYNHQHTATPHHTTPPQFDGA